MKLLTRDVRELGAKIRGSFLKMGCSLHKSNARLFEQYEKEFIHAVATKQHNDFFEAVWWDPLRSFMAALAGHIATEAAR